MVSPWLALSDGNTTRAYYYQVFIETKIQEAPVLLSTMAITRNHSGSTRMHARTL